MLQTFEVHFADTSELLLLHHSRDRLRLVERLLKLQFQGAR